MKVTCHSVKTPAALVSLFEALEAPGLVLDEGGRILGASDALLDLSRRLNVGVLATFGDLVPDASVPDLAELRTAWVERPLTLVDGSTRRARWVRLEGLGEGTRLALVFDDARAPAGVAGGSSVREARRASRLCHDLAGPLTAILGTTELLLMREEAADGEIRERLQDVISQCARISELIARDRADGPGQDDA